MRIRARWSGPRTAELSNRLKLTVIALESTAEWLLASQLRRMHAGVQAQPAAVQSQANSVIGCCHTHTTCVSYTHAGHTWQKWCRGNAAAISMTLRKMQDRGVKRESFKTGSVGA